MPDPTRTHREFQPSTNQALAELEEATGKPVLILGEPELNVAATFRRAAPGQAKPAICSAARAVAIRSPIT